MTPQPSQKQIHAVSRSRVQAAQCPLSDTARYLSTAAFRPSREY